MPTVKVNIGLIGDEDDVLSFIALCGKIQMLGELGASRIIPVDIDGDGSARFRFKIEAEVKDIGPIDLITQWRKHNGDNFKNQIETKIDKHYIGE